MNLRFLALLTMLCATIAGGAAEAKVINLEFDTDGDFSTLEGVGSITVDDSFFTGSPFSVLTNDAGVSFNLNIGGVTFDTANDGAPWDTFLEFDSAGNFVGTDDQTGNFSDVFASGTLVGSIASTMAFSDEVFGNFILFEYDVNTGILPGGISGTGNWRIAAVPVPASLPLLIACLSGLGFIARRKHK